MIHENKKIKLVLAVLVFLFAHFYPELKNLVINNFDYLPLSRNESGEKGDFLAEREIISSWKSLIQLPKQNLDRKLKIVIG
jgi:hypothetical protein